MQKRMFKVLSPMSKADGGTWWMRVGSAFLNKDESINVYLDAVPKDLKFQIREMTEEDLRYRDQRAAQRSSGAAGMPGAPGAPGVTDSLPLRPSEAHSDALPF